MTTRMIALALTASALIAGPAAAETAKVNLAGKTPDQIAQAVWAAAHKACRSQDPAVTIVSAHRACVAKTYRQALASSGVPALAALAVPPRES